MFVLGGALGVISAVLVMGLLRKRPRRKVGVDLAQAAVAVALAAAFWYLVPRTLGEPIGSVLLVGLGGGAFIVAGAIFVHRLLATS
jgi:hypothetical protein